MVSLEKVGGYCRHYLRLMKYWQRVLPNPIHEIHYEDTVEHTEQVARDVLSYLELPWNDACLRFHENQRSVKTASLAQVRQPIYKRSVRRWERYAKHLAPLRQAIGLE
jgi:hypothetical protein